MSLIKSTARKPSTHHAQQHKGNQPFFAPQTKLEVGKPGDKYEREADSVAEQVVQKQAKPEFLTPTPFFNNDNPFFPPAKPKQAPVQKKEDSGSESQEIQEKPLAESITPVVQLSAAPEPPDEQTDTELAQRACDTCAAENAQEEKSAPVQMKCAECEKKEKQNAQLKAEGGTPVQTKCAKCAEADAVAQGKQSGTSSSPSSAVESSLSASRGKGYAMDNQTRSSMESGFGADFSGVRIHTGSEAVQMNKELGSHAFTSGNDIYFNQGKYDPGSKGGQTLLAHELTHTVQQGASQSKVQQKEEELPSDNIQPFAPTAVQLSEDPCAEPDEQGSQGEASSEESTATDPNCAPGNPAVEQPADGQEEPDGEDSAREIEANEGGPVDERQSHAPPADENAPEGDESIGEDAAEGAEQSLDPCALREQAGGEGASGEAGGGAGAAAGAATADSGGGGETPAGDAQGNAEGGEQATAEGPQEGEENFLATAVAQGAASLAVSGGLGEEASPELRDERDAQQTSVEEQRVRGEETQATIEQMVSQGANYKLPKRGSKRKSVIQNHEMVNTMTSAFMSSAGERINGILNSGMSSAAQIQSDTALKKAMLSEQIEMKKARIMAFYFGAKMNAQAKADAAKASVEAQHVTTLAQIEMSALAAAMAVQQNFETKTLELQQGYDAQLLALDEAYTSGHAKLMATGNRMGNAAVAFGDAKADAYEADAVYEYEGFWDGYITYNRQMARVDAARETGRQYKEGMVSQAEAQADQMMCGKASDLELLGTMLTQGNETLNCALLNGLDAVALQRQGAIMQAQHAHDELISNIDQSLAATLAQFNEKETSQIQLVNDYGIRQSMAIEMAADQAIASTMEGINTAVDQLVEFLRNYQATVQKTEAPSLEQFGVAQAQVEQEFSASVESTQSAIASSIETAQASLEEGFTQALVALNELYQQGIAEGRMLESGFNSTIDSLLVGATTSYAQLLSNAQLTLAAEQENATMTLAAVATGILGLMTSTVSGVTSQFDQADTSMAEGMQSTIDNDLDAKICSEAEKAAADVQPWWKTALKILLVIVVIVVVALVIGPAVIGAVGAAASALAGSLGAGAALAGTIGAWAGPIIGGAIVGALSGAVIQVGNNLIDIAGTDRELSWDNITEGVWGAMIAGAIGGALGGLGGQFAQVLMGRFGAALGTGWQTVAKFGIESAFDVVGGILGDLAAGNPITWESIVMGLAIGGAVQVSMGGLSALARNGVSTPTPHGDGGVSGPRLNPDGTPRTGFKSRVQDTARSIQDFQGRMMESGQNFGNRAGFGANAPDVATTRQGIIDANARMEGGEFFPTRDVETTSPRPDAEADVNTPRTEGEGEVTTRQDGEGEATTRPEGDGDTNRTPDEIRNDVLEETGPKGGAELTPDEIRAEFESFKDGTARRSTDPDYEWEVELSNGHKWKRTRDGRWCRNPNLHCFIGEMPLQDDREFYNFLKREGLIDADMSFDDFLSTKPGGPEPGTEISSSNLSEHPKPSGGAWDSAPNFSKWIEKGGRILVHGDGSYTYIMGDLHVKYSANGYPDFNGHLTHPDVQSVDITPPFSPNRTPDYRKANDKVRESHPDWPYTDKAPSGYVWHHHENGTSMQLVLKSVHDLFDHAGGISNL